MHSRNLRKLSWSALTAAAAGLWAPQAHATAYCPSGNSATINCNNCSYELTCDLNNFTLWIYGTNVTLDGQGHTIYNSPGVAVTLSTPGGATVKNLNVQYSGDAAFQTYNSGASGYTFSYLQNVTSYAATTDGVFHAAPFPLETSGAWFAYSGYDGVLATSTRYADFLSSTAYGSSHEGYDGRSPGSYVVGNSTGGNSGAGIYAQTTNLLISNNTIYNNSDVGLDLGYGSGHYLNGNNGYDNYSGGFGFDCIDNSTSSTHGTNTWQHSHIGPACQ